jgi:hypothetical protein
VRFLQFLQLEEEANIRGRSGHGDTVSQEGSQYSEPNLVRRLEAGEIQAHGHRQLRDHALQLRHHASVQASVDHHDLTCVVAPRTYPKRHAC